MSPIILCVQLALAAMALNCPRHLVTVHKIAEYCQPALVLSSRAIGGMESATDLSLFADVAAIRGCAE